MIEVVRENPCTECGIKGLYEHCEDKCVQYRKWYQYQQGRADAIKECIKVAMSVGAKEYSFYEMLRQMKQLKEQTE